MLGSDWLSSHERFADSELIFSHHSELILLCNIQILYRAVSSWYIAVHFSPSENISRMAPMIGIGQSDLVLSKLDLEARKCGIEKFNRLCALKK